MQINKVNLYRAAFCAFVFVLAIPAAWSGQDVTLKDRHGAVLRPDAIDKYDPVATCGDCHDVKAQGRSVHFNRISSDDANADCLACHLGSGKRVFNRDGSISRVLPKPEESACLGCHTPTQNYQHIAQDAHANLACIGCHTEAGHKADPLPSCTGCHLSSSSKRHAPSPIHQGLTKLHLERISCEACHIRRSNGNGKDFALVESNGRIIAAGSDGLKVSHGVSVASLALGAKGCNDCHNVKSPMPPGLRQSNAVSPVREAIIKPLTMPLIIAVLIACIIHRCIFGVKRTKKVNGDQMVKRYDLLGRILHASLAASFIVLSGTGLLFILHLETPYSPIRHIHSLVGPVFALSVAAIAVKWRKDSRFVAADRLWLECLGGYFGSARKLSAGKFNAGQKMLFWLSICVGIILTLSAPGMLYAKGLIRVLSYTLHDAAAIGLLMIILVHIYLGVVVVPGALKAIITGRVSRAWVEKHHPDWTDEPHH